MQELAEGKLWGQCSVLHQKREKIHKYQMDHTQPGTKSTDLRVRVENKLTVRSSTSIFLRCTGRHGKWILAAGIWLELFLLPRPIICIIALTH